MSAVMLPDFRGIDVIIEDQRVGYLSGLKHLLQFQLRIPKLYVSRRSRALRERR
jgi:hypothetical protein